MSWLNQNEDDPEDMSNRYPRSAKIGWFIAGVIVVACIVGIVWGGPCSKPDNDPEASACAPDTVIDGKKVDGPDGILDWTKPFQEPNEIPNGLLFGSLLAFAVLAALWYVGFQRYYAPKFVTPEGAFAFDSTRHLRELPGRRFAFARLGGVPGEKHISANEGAVLFPLGALRRHGRNFVLHMRSIPKDLDFLPEFAKYLMEREVGTKGPFFEAVAAEDVEAVDAEHVARIMAENRKNLRENTAHEELVKVAKTSKVALDHASLADSRFGRKTKERVIVERRNGHRGDDDG